MYHIKSDRRSQSSAAQIVQALQACLKTTPLKSVTVSDIHRVSGVSRATFYRLFDTPEDVLLYQLDQVTNASVNVEDYDGVSSRQTMESIITLGLQNHEFLKALVENGRHDLLFYYTEKSLRLLDERQNLLSSDMEPAEREYIIAQMSMGMVATQITWARNGQKETPQEILGYLKHYAQMMMGLMETE